MASFTNAQLLAALQAWPEDNSPEFQSNLPLIITMGERRLVKDLNLELFDQVSTIPTVAGDRLLPKPASFVATRELNVVVANEVINLERRSPSFCERFAFDRTAEGVPTYFCEISSTHWQLVDTPDAIYSVEARCIVRPDGLATNTAGTYFSLQHGDLLFAACLLESEMYLKGDERLPILRERYFSELLPVARLECRDMIRADYEPIKAAAQKV